MKTKEFRNGIIEFYICNWLVFDTYTMKKAKYIQNEDGTIDVEGDIKIRDYPFSKLPFKFGKINGNFDCCYNHLETFENFPHIVTGIYGSIHNPLPNSKHKAKEYFEYVEKLKRNKCV